MHLIQAKILPYCWGGVKRAGKGGAVHVLWRGQDALATAGGDAGATFVSRRLAGMPALFVDSVAGHAKDARQFFSDCRRVVCAEGFCWRL